ncbi:MAG: hypothetical protein PS018_04345 [bacterium]|nr:hypothetical protein [bacterium]
MYTKEMRELGADELDRVAGGLDIGPFHISYSQGSGAIDVGIGNTGVYIGPNGAGWYSGDRYGQIKFR